MSRIKLPDFENKKQAFKYLRDNHDKIISLKSAEPIKSEECSLGCSGLSMSKDSIEKYEKTEGEQIKDSSHIKADPIGTLKEGEIKVKAYANVIGWCDSHYDVLIKDSAKKTIKDKGASNKQLIYHLKNHGRTTDDVIGKHVKMSLEDIELNQFNIVSDIKQTQVIIGESVVSEAYDQKCFKLYADNEIKQHSIGLMYIKMFFCMDSDEDEDAMYKENFDRYFPEVINKEKVKESGYFWAVTQIRLLEYSAVLWGSNELSITADYEPSEDTQKEEDKGEPLKNTDFERKRKLSII